MVLLGYVNGQPVCLSTHLTDFAGSAEMLFPIVDGDTALVDRFVRLFVVNFLLLCAYAGLAVAVLQTCGCWLRGHRAERVGYHWLGCHRWDAAAVCCMCDTHPSNRASK